LRLVLVVDDVRAMAEQYAYDLKRVGGYEVLIAGGGAAALEHLAGEAIDCVILDLEMPGVDGFEVLRTMKERGDATPVIVYTGTGNYARCVQAIKLGAYSFIDKAESMERVVREVENALEHVRLVSEVETLRRELGAESPLIGSSRPIQQLKTAIARVAPIPSPVLVVGESGSGKELVARELHRIGPDPKKPFVAINSAALPENLVESELFGHERGAFTGANRTRKGAFELASGGTLFLDEIGELSAPAQAKLLRVIEERQVMRVGGERTISVDVRVVAAPLRDRLSDVPELAEHFVVETCRRFGIRPKKLAADASQALMRHNWRQNNVRELRNIIERMIIACDAEALTAADVPAEIASEAPPAASDGPRTFQQLKAEAERQIIVAALERNDWHITNTARELGLADHASLLKIMRRHGLKRRE
jgi:two-component system nitrogen regulation response regulator NtrX